MEIFNNNTGELICREETYHGQGADVSGKGSPTTPGKGEEQLYLYLFWCSSLTCTLLLSSFTSRWPDPHSY